MIYMNGTEYFYQFVWLQGTSLNWASIISTMRIIKLLKRSHLLVLWALEVTSAQVNFIIIQEVADDDWAEETENENQQSNAEEVPNGFVSS